MHHAPRTLIAAMGLALPAWLGAQTTHYVGNSPELVTAIQNYTAGDTIEFAADINLTWTLPALNADVTINGNGHTLSGSSFWRGFTAYAGNITIMNLTISETRALGGDGGFNGRGGGGGGGLGAGGAVFIRSGATVTLDNVALVANSAVGGRGGFAATTLAASSSGGGGGGLWQAGGMPRVSGAAPGGGDVNGQGGSTAELATGNAGFGGGGQGSGVIDTFEYFGGSGGFGGGGGGGSAITGGSAAGIGGLGGYGGGGGGGNGNGSIPGTGGFAGADGQGGLPGPGGSIQGWGGAGASLGGAIFLMEGGTLNVVGNLTQSGGHAMTSYDGQRGAGSGIFLQGNGTLGFAPAAGQTVTISDQLADETGTGFPAVVANGRPSDLDGGTGVWGLTKSGIGTLVFAGDNLYTGATTVTGGLLVMDGSSWSATTVENGGALGGAGIFHALATIEAGGVLAPGNSPGMITFAAGLQLDDGAVLDFELGAVSDMINVTGGVLAGPVGAGGVTFIFTAGSGFGPGNYTLIDGTDATLSGFDLTDFNIGTNISGYHALLGMSGHTLSVTFTAIPEPAAWATALGVLALGFAYFGRRAQR